MKTPKEELESFIRSNKQRREITAKKKGYRNADIYMNILKAKVDLVNNPPVQEKKTSKKKDSIQVKTMHDIVILDASGSMVGKEQVVIEGYNNHIATLKENAKKLNIEVYHSLYIFSDRVHGTKFLLEREKVENVKTLQEYKYTPKGGTPLYDSYLEVIERFIDKDQNASVTGITDGDDMHSYKTSSAKVAVKQAQDKGWVVALIGPKGTYIERAIKTLNIDKSNSLEIENSSKGIKAGFTAYAQASSVTLDTLATTGVVKKTGFFQKKK